MAHSNTSSSVPLPRSWHASVRSSLLHVISLAQFALAHTRGWAANSINQRVRLRAESDRAQQELALLREEVRIKDGRMAQIDPHRRPHYPPTERMAILETKAARGWSLEQTAKAFLVTPATIASWMGRLDEQGPDALVQLRTPVNRFPDFVRYAVQRLKTLCPTMGKVKIAQTLARAGLHLGATTAGRMVKEKPRPGDCPDFRVSEHGTVPLDARHAPAPAGKQRVVTAKYPGHLWHVDLTVMSTALGFWTSWFPFALPQRWPFAWWLAFAVDHFSRRVMGYAVFDKEPSSEQVRAMLGRAISAAGKAPRHLVCDHGSQFDCDDFRRWCRRKRIQPPRYGAIGQHGSLAVIERLILTVKLLLRRLPLMPLRRKDFHREVGLVIDWYDEHRAHTTLRGRTPNEVYFDRFPANRKPRFEPRSCWPRGSPCARPWALVKGKPGVRIELDVEFQAGRRRLPVVRVRRAA